MLGTRFMAINEFRHKSLDISYSLFFQDFLGSWEIAANLCSREFTACQFDIDGQFVPELFTFIPLNSKDLSFFK